MAPQVPHTPIPFPTTNITFQEPTIAITAEADDHDHDFIAVTFPKQNIQKEEKQITIDPMSLKEASPVLHTTTILTPPPPLHPPKSKFLSISQPNSATPSPRFAALKKKPKGDPQQILALELLQEQEIYLQKSKSCGEGRASAPCEGFEDFLFINPKIEGSFSPNSKSNRHEDDEIESTHSNSKGFKCCLYLPGFGKTKPNIRFNNKKEESNSNPNPNPNSMNIDGAIISRTVSLERFECGSWAPSSPRAIIQADMEINDTLSSHYFDLPSELIRCGAGAGDDDDAHSPVTAAFVFDKDIKGVLKNGTTSRGRKSDASPRHVRFSTSSPPSSSTPPSPASSCITPRLRRAREEFNAFLEAQSV